jgi:5-methylcytosine-specific restriction enzyme A
MALKYCKHPGCSKLTRARYCAKHKHLEDKAMKETKARHDQTRPSASARGYDNQWGQYRKAFLRRNPLCVMCLKMGRTTPATVVDHVVPCGPGSSLFYEELNHQSLCASCHGAKTVSDDRKGFGKGVRGVKNIAANVAQDRSAPDLRDSE